MKLNRDEMKKIMGGLTAGTTSCSTTCNYGPKVEITDCNGTCIAIDHEYVYCSAAPADKVYCAENPLK